MIKLDFRKAIVLSVFFVASVAFAGAPSEKMTQELLDKSGLTNQVKSMPQQFSLGLQQAGVSFGDDTESLLKGVEESIAPESILADMKNAIKTSLTKKDVKALLSWYESEPGTAITKAEEYATTVEGANEMMAQMQSVAGNIAAMEMAKRLDSHIGGTDLAMEMQQSMMVAAMVAMNNVMSPGQAMDMDAIQLQVAAIGAQSRPQIEQVVYLSYAYTYKKFDDVALNKYEAFLSKPEYQKFNQAFLKGYKAGLSAAIEKLANMVAESIKAQTAKAAPAAPVVQ